MTSRILVAAAALVVVAGAQTPAAADPTEAFFKKGEIPRFVLELAPEEYEKLKKDGRTYVRATLRENDKTVFEDVAVKLKGAAGSYRELEEEKPGFTVHMGKHRRGGLYRGMEKFHLNNAVQDDTYLHELLASDLFRAAGLPATRVSHARVKLNGRDLGLYVFKESFDRKFLERSFPKSGGDLYDGGFCQDVDADLQKDVGKGPEERGELKALLAACLEPDAKRRRERMEAALDVPQFTTFFAMERMLSHWDGYCMNRNNYRLYFDPGSKKAVFLPHGMDQILVETEASVLDAPIALVAAAFNKFPEWRAAYRKRVVALLPLFSPEKLHKRVDEVAARLRPVLAAMSEGAARDHEDRVKALKDRITARAKSLKEQSVLPDPKPLAFEKGFVVLKNWRPASECDDARLMEAKVAGERTYRIVCGRSGRCIAAWRTTVLLARGKYVFQATAQTEDAVSLAGEAGGARVRLGADVVGSRIDGTSFWKPLEVAFEVTEEQRDVELVMELRCSKGQAWFRADSLKLSKAK